MKEIFDLEKPFDLGAYLHHRGLTAVPGSLAEFVTGNSTVTTVQAVPYDQSMPDRCKFVFWTWQELNAAGDYDIFLSALHEEKLNIP